MSITRDTVRDTTEVTQANPHFCWWHTSPRRQGDKLELEPRLSLRSMTIWFYLVLFDQRFTSLADENYSAVRTHVTLGDPELFQLVYHPLLSLLPHQQPQRTSGWEPLYPAACPSKLLTPSRVAPSCLCCKQFWTVGHEGCTCEDPTLTGFMVLNTLCPTSP